uniref:Putative secreted protein n=1 Tax=Ixodes ricinus TaxID=34613 RepID=A0A6B0TSQ2_IXORI
MCAFVQLFHAVLLALFIKCSPANHIGLWTVRVCVCLWNFRHVLSNRGKTGNMRLPKEESCGMKNPTELEWAC